MLERHALIVGRLQEYHIERGENLAAVCEQYELGRVALGVAARRVNPRRLFLPWYYCQETVDFVRAFFPRVERYHLDCTLWPAPNKVSDRKTC